MIRALLPCLTLIAAPLAAQDGAVQPLVSEPYEVTDARAAMDEIMRRDDEADAEAERLILSGEIALSDFVPFAPRYQQVSWPDDECVDLVSLFPSPPEGWVISSDWGRYENPIGEERGELHYVKLPDLPVDDPNFVSQTESVTVRVVRSEDQIMLWDMRMENEMMRDAAFEEGPFGYPITRFVPATLLGEYYVDVSGTGDVNAPMFFEMIIGCAIDNGLLANGVDPATLSR